MNKVYAPSECYSPVIIGDTRTVVCYGYEDAEEPGYGFWYEVYFYRKQGGVPDIDKIISSVYNDINSQTDEKILSGFRWSAPSTESEMKVWLSSENQFNYKAAFDLAIQTQGQSLPVTFKFGDDDTPVYFKFEDLQTLQDFYVKAMSYINACLEEGWQRKDSIDWEPYKEALKPAPEPEESNEELNEENNKNNEE